MLRIELNVAPDHCYLRYEQQKGRNGKVMDLKPYSLFTNNNYLYLFGHISIESVNFIISISLHS